MTWRMPAEWQEHECTWMAWPSASYTLGDNEIEHHVARQTWANVANAISRFEPVKMLVNTEDLPVARPNLEAEIELIQAELDDAWMRDIGPSFVLNSAGEVAAVDWVFNGWGGQSWANWQKDAKIARAIASLADVPAISSKLINEGGGIHVNGAGEILLTETVQLGEGRNSNLTKTEVEAELSQKLGATNFTWLKRGLTRDYDEFGTRGHVDIVACFANENTILFHDQNDPAHPDFEISREVRATLESTGRFNVISVPAPKKLSDEGGFVDYSYINHYICNGAVILCAFEDENDDKAKEILQNVYFDREIVQVNATALFERGGGIHCITQQQPKELK